MKIQSDPMGLKTRSKWVWMGLIGLNSSEGSQSNPCWCFSHLRHETIETSRRKFMWGIGTHLTSPNEVQNASNKIWSIWQRWLHLTHCEWFQKINCVLPSLHDNNRVQKMDHVTTNQKHVHVCRLHWVNRVHLQPLPCENKIVCIHISVFSMSPIFWNCNNTCSQKKVWHHKVKSSCVIHVHLGRAQVTTWFCVTFFHWRSCAHLTLRASPFGLLFWKQHLKNGHWSNWNLNILEQKHVDQNFVCPCRRLSNKIVLWRRIESMHSQQTMV